MITIIILSPFKVIGIFKNVIKFKNILNLLPKNEK